jgi:YHS domain-containing protein
MQHTDPVCGMTVDERTPWKSEHSGESVYFCSAACKQKFDANPGQYPSHSAAALTAVRVELQSGSAATVHKRMVKW